MLVCPAIIYVTHVKEWDTARQLDLGEERVPPVVQSLAAVHPVYPGGEVLSQPLPPEPCGGGASPATWAREPRPAEGAAVGCVCPVAQSSLWSVPEVPRWLLCWGTAGPCASLSLSLAGGLAGSPAPGPRALPGGPRAGCRSASPGAVAVGLPCPFLLGEQTLGDTFPTPALLPRHVLGRILAPCWGRGWAPSRPPTGAPSASFGDLVCGRPLGARAHHPVLPSPGLVPKPAK